MAAIDTSAFTALFASLDNVTSQLDATISGDVTAAVNTAVAAQKAADANDVATAVAAQLAEDQTANDAVVAELQGKITALTAAAGAAAAPAPAEPAPAPLSDPTPDAPAA